MRGTPNTKASQVVCDCGRLGGACRRGHHGGKRNLTVKRYSFRYIIADEEAASCGGQTMCGGLCYAFEEFATPSTYYVCS